MAKSHNTTPRTKSRKGSRTGSRDPLSAVAAEFEEMVRLTTLTRKILDAELSKLKGDKLGEKQHVVWMLVKLADSVTKLMREGRQLERQSKKSVEDMTDAEVFQTLINAGWKPPAGWTPPSP